MSLIVIPFLFLLFVAAIFLSIIMYLQDLFLSNFCFFFSLQSRNKTEIHQITVSWAELCSCLHIFRGVCSVVSVCFKIVLLSRVIRPDRCSG